MYRAKNVTCLTAAQIQAAIQINQGPRVNGKAVLDPAGAVAPDHANNVVQGYEYDGGWMATTGIRRERSGPAAQPLCPATFPWGWYSGLPVPLPLCPTCYTLDYDFKTGTLVQSGNIMY